MLVSATYDGDLRIAVLKFYDTELNRIHLWYDNTGHKPYCYTKLPREELEFLRTRKDILGVEEESRKDLLTDQIVSVRKIIATDPLAIGGGQKSLRDEIRAWEADIKYYENYAYDRGLRMGVYYRVSAGKVLPIESDVPERVGHSLEEIFRKNPPEFAPYLREWAELLGQPLCDFKRIAMDIEVANEEGRIPDPEEAELPIIAVSFFNDKEKIVYLLARGEMPSEGVIADGRYSVVVFEREEDLIRAAFEKMMDYPVVVTFNGDDFDLRYLKHRAEKRGLKEEEAPIQLMRQEAAIKHGIHVDLYRFFNNKSIQVYAFGNRYSEHTLNGIAEALLGKSKVEYDGEIGDLPAGKLADYCLNDSQLTYELTTMTSSVVVKLLIVLSRIGKMPMNDVARLGVSNWIRSMLFYEHRKIGALIPRQDELAEKGGASSQAIIKGKKYKGGLVIEPKPGIYFGVSVLDFASLYPSLIKVDNLSYETVRCVHEECKTNLVPDTTHWVCTKRKGITSLVIGSLRDLRVNHYKPLARDPNLSKDERELYNAVSQGLKVILNASYGVTGFETFAFYCLPVAEATAAFGRDAITKTIEKCKYEGISVIYGDTDSLFVENPNKEKVAEVVRWADQELAVELDIDKVYRYVAFSERKKNYFGVLEDGTVDIKGLTGKKSQTPEFLKKTFYKTLDILSGVHSQPDFEQAKSRIKELLTDTMKRLMRREIPIPDLAFNVMMGKTIDGYGPPKNKNQKPRKGEPKLSETNEQSTLGGEKAAGATSGLPQHVKAAELLRRTGKEIKAGEIISYVKTTDARGVKPTALARKEEIDVEKYLEYASSMFDQILDSIGVNFDEIVPRTSLDSFWS